MPKQSLKDKLKPDTSVKDLLWQGITGAIIGLIISGAFAAKKLGVDGIWDYPDDHWPLPRILLYGAMVGLLVSLVLRVVLIPRALKEARETAALNKAAQDFLFLALNAYGSAERNESNPDRYSAAAREILSEARESLLKGFGARLCVLTPDASGTRLVPYAHSKMPSISNDPPTTFVIDKKGDTGAGIAGNAFHFHKPIKVKMEQQVREDGTHVWRANNPAFLIFTKDGSRLQLPLTTTEPERQEDPLYKSFICTRITKGGDDKGVLGVLCVDSQAQSTFETRAVEELVLLVGKALAPLLERVADGQKGARIVHSGPTGLVPPSIAS